MATRAVSTIFCGNTTLSISNDGLVYSMGTQEDNNVEEENYVLIKRIPSLTKIVSLSSGLRHSIFLDMFGNVFTFGGNSYHQLGVILGDSLETNIPQKVNLPPISQISSGTFFNMCLSEDGELYSFGENNDGQLGVGNTKVYELPQKVESLKEIEIEFVQCGGEYTFCKTYSDVYVWGRNGSGQFGLGVQKSTNLSIEGWSEIEFDIGDQNPHFPIKCRNWPENVVDIKCGMDHTLVLTSNQEVFSCGNNFYGQVARDINTCIITSELKKIESLSGIWRIECGYNYSICIDNEYNLFVFGCNVEGQLGLGDDLKETNKPTKHPSLCNIIDVSSKGYQTFVKNIMNEIFAFGDNKRFQLGVKSEKDKQSTPIQVFKGQEDIWSSNVKSKAKSANF